MISALHHKSKFEFRTFLKKYSNFWVSCCNTREDLSIDVSITNACRTDIDEARVISFLGVRTDEQTDRQTDRHGFGILIWKHVGTQKMSTQNSKLVVSCRSLYASPEVGMHN